MRSANETSECFSENGKQCNAAKQINGKMKIEDECKRLLTKYSIPSQSQSMSVASILCNRQQLPPHFTVSMFDCNCKSDGSKVDKDYAFRSVCQFIFTRKKCTQIEINLSVGAGPVHQDKECTFSKSVIGAYQ